MTFSFGGVITARALKEKEDLQRELEEIKARSEMDTHVGISLNGIEFPEKVFPLVLFLILMPLAYEGINNTNAVGGATVGLLYI